MKAVNKIKYIVCAVLLIASFVLCGCGVRVDLYEEVSDDKYKFVLDICVKEEVDSKLNAGAKVNEQTGKKWTLGDWLNAYMRQLKELYGFDYVYTGVMNDPAAKEKVYRFREMEVGLQKEYLKDSLTINSEYDVQGTNLFFRTIKVERDDRFNYFISEFKDAYSRLDSGPIAADGETAMGIFLFGVRNVYPFGDPTDPDLKVDEETGEVYKIVLPAFGDAFDVDVSDYKNLGLRNFWHVGARINAESDDTAMSNVSGYNKFYYVFAKQVGDGETTVRYSYVRADPTGWYIVAILAGGITVGLVILSVKIKKKKQNAPPPEQPQDNFPYDPFDGNIDPFA